MQTKKIFIFCFFFLASFTFSSPYYYQRHHHNKNMYLSLVFQVRRRRILWVKNLPEYIINVLCILHRASFLLMNDEPDLLKHFFQLRFGCYKKNAYERKTVDLMCKCFWRPFYKNDFWRFICFFFLPRENSRENCDIMRCKEEFKNPRSRGVK